MSSPTSRGPTTISTLSPLASGTFSARLTPPEEEDEAKARSEGGPFAAPWSAVGRVSGAGLCRG